LPVSRPSSSSCLVVVAAALVDHAGQILMQQRPAGRDHGGLWEYPGGKVEPGEGPMAALVRELHEELAIAVNPADLYPLGFASREGGTGRPIALLLYGCCRWQGDPVSQEGAVLAWCTPDMLTAHPQPPLDIPLAGAAIGFATGMGGRHE
jgi:8-oxo-dGTP diphosphatase